MHIQVVGFKQKTKKKNRTQKSVSAGILARVRKGSPEETSGLWLKGLKEQNHERLRLERKSGRHCQQWQKKWDFTWIRRKDVSVMALESTS